MATPVNLPASFTAGNIFTAAQANGLRGAFRILQVVSATTTTNVASSTSTYVSTTLSANITPQSTSSKILVIVNHSVYTYPSATGGGMILRRDSTNLQVFADVGYNSGAANLTTFGTMYLDSPSSTSAISYNTIQNRGIGTGQFFTQINGNPGTIILMEVSA